ncbi:MAG TPA: FmdB family zinc ribbon protein [Lapillicoccus sp.]
MPTYAYACTACGHAFDAVQKFTDAALTECPECGGRLRKVYTSIGVAFKGSGFYRNDSRAATKGESGKSSDSSDSSAEKSSEKSAEKSADKSSDKGSEKSPATSSGTSNGSTEKSTPTTSSSKSSAAAAR